MISNFFIIFAKRIFAKIIIRFWVMQNSSFEFDLLDPVSNLQISIFEFEYLFLFSNLAFLMVNSEIWILNLKILV